MNFVDESIQSYCVAHSTRVSALCDELEKHTRQNVPLPQMLTGPLEGSFLALLVSLTSARRVLEIGTYTGYSALAMAERLPPDGELVTLDINPETAKLAQSYWDRSPHGAKIRQVLGDARESLQKQQGPFDLVFIDADKGSYPAYFKGSLERLAPGGLIAIDNTLRSGMVLEKNPQDPETATMKKFNAQLAADPSLEVCLLPVRDGITLVRRRR